LQQLDGSPWASDAPACPAAPVAPTEHEHLGMEAAHRPTRMAGVLEALCKTTLEEACQALRTELQSEKDKSRDMSSAHDEKVTDLQAKLTAVEHTNSVHIQKVEALQAEVAGAQHKLGDASRLHDQKVAALQAELDAAQTELHDISSIRDQNVTQLQAELVAARAELAGAQRKLGDASCLHDQKVEALQAELEAAEGKLKLAEGKLAEVGQRRPGDMTEVANRCQNVQATLNSAVNSAEKKLLNMNDNWAAFLQLQILVVLGIVVVCFFWSKHAGKAACEELPSSAALRRGLYSPTPSEAGSFRMVYNRDPNAPVADFQQEFADSHAASDASSDSWQVAVNRD